MQQAVARIHIRSNGVPRSSSSQNKKCKAGVRSELRSGRVIPELVGEFPEFTLHNTEVPVGDFAQVFCVQILLHRKPLLGADTARREGIRRLREKSSGFAVKAQEVENVAQLMGWVQERIFKPLEHC